MGKTSREKGKRGERELAAMLTEFGFPARRAQQFKGTETSFDIECPRLGRMGMVVECKNVARPSIGAWLDAAHETAGNQTPVLFWKRPRGSWYAIVPAEALLRAIGGRAA